MKLKPPFFVALDVDDKVTALDLAKKLKGHVGGFKIGPRLTYKYGEELTREVATLGTVFVDNKYHDIPSTMIAGIRASFEAGATFITIHASCGPDALKQMAQLEKELNKKRPLKILCVTVLTSLGEGQMPANWRDEKIDSHVLKLAREAYACGLTGIVASPNEVTMLRKHLPDAFILTPGIRLPEDKTGDQVRVMGPKEAMQAGSSALVIGRTILDAADPVKVAKSISELLNS